MSVPLGDGGFLSLMALTGTVGLVPPRTALASASSSSIGATDRFSPTSPCHEQGALGVMSYRRHRTMRGSRPTRLELATYGLEDRRSFRLSYGRDLRMHIT